MGKKFRESLKYYTTKKYFLIFRPKQKKNDNILSHCVSEFSVYISEWVGEWMTDPYL